MKEVLSLTDLRSTKEIITREHYEQFLPTAFNDLNKMDQYVKI